VLVKLVAAAVVLVVLVAVAVAVVRIWWRGVLAVKGCTPPSCCSSAPSATTRRIV
jgi:hypothetical protein